MGELGCADAGVLLPVTLGVEGELSESESNARQYSASRLEIPVPVCCQNVFASASCSTGEKMT